MARINSITPTISIESIIDVAEEAGREILTYYKSSVSWTEKDDKSPLTEADIASHNLIISKLQTLYPYPIISEEAPVPYETRKSWNTFWLVDPLDGTKDFLAMNDEFTVNIGLIHNNRPIAGVVHIPAWNTTYYASLSAFKKINNEISTVSYSTKEELICLESRFHKSDKTSDFCNRYNINVIKEYGSSIKICKIAEGSADVYPRYVPTKEWDTAAAHCILNAAGGVLIDQVTNTELIYNKPNIQNNPFIAMGNGHNFSL